MEKEMPEKQTANPEAQCLKSGFPGSMVLAPVGLDSPFPSTLMSAAHGAFLLSQLSFLHKGFCFVLSCFSFLFLTGILHNWPDAIL